MISIHALRGEGDCGCAEMAAVYRHFNPRPPWGGRPCRCIWNTAKRWISIHALRGEGDMLRCSFAASFPIFQSTPSVGRATCRGYRAHRRRSHFNPRPPWGGRRCERRNNYPELDFNPRPPWGGRRPSHRVRGLRASYFNPRPPWGGRPTAKSCRAR